MAKKASKVTKDFSEELQDLLGKTKNPGLLGKKIEIGLKKIIELERDAHIGAESYKHTESRKTYRNGYKPHKLKTRVGCITLRMGV